MFSLQFSNPVNICKINSYINTTRSSCNLSITTTCIAIVRARNQTQTLAPIITNCIPQSVLKIRAALNIYNYYMYATACIRNLRFFNYNVHTLDVFRYDRCAKYE